MFRHLGLTHVSGKDINKTPTVVQNSRRVLKSLSEGILFRTGEEDNVSYEIKDLVCFTLFDIENVLRQIILTKGQIFTL